MTTAKPHAYEHTSSTEQASTVPNYANTAIRKPVNPSTYYTPLTIGTTEEENVYESPDDVKITVTAGRPIKVPYFGTR